MMPSKRRTGAAKPPAECHQDLAMPMTSDPGKPAQRLRVIDSISAPAGAVNDDRAGHAGNCVWVIDGATDCGADKYLPGQSDAAWLAGKFNDGLLARAPAPGIALPGLIETITESVARDFQAERIRDVADRMHRPSAAALIGRLDAGIFETVSLGDCQLFVARPGQRARLCGVERSRLGDRNAIARIKATMKEEGLDWLSARAKLKPRSDEGRRRMNRPGGYGVLSIDMAPADLIHREAIPLDSGTRVLLATDGFARLYEVFSAYSEETLLNAAFEKGLPALIRELRALENSDAACEKAPRIKPRDDATAILVLAD
jgi:Protein phosphatase 2C